MHQYTKFTRTIVFLFFFSRANYIHSVLNQFSLGKTEETKPVCKELQSQVFSLMLFRPSLVNVHKEIGTIKKVRIIDF